MLLLVNPAAGRGDTAQLTEPVAAVLRRAGSVRVETPAGPADATRLVRTAAGDVDAVAVLGGDGTVHPTLQALAGTSTPLAVLPAGSGNDLAASVGMPVDPLAAADAVVAALEAGSVRAVDLGRVEGDRDGAGDQEGAGDRAGVSEADRWWATVLCAGFDSAVAERVARVRWPRRLPAPRRHDAAIAAELARLRPRQFLLQLDGRFLDGPATLVAVGNTPQYGGGKLIAPQARLADGRFAVTVVGPVGRVTLARLAPRLATAGHIGHPAVRTYTATTVSIDAADTVAYADGERIAALPLSTSCVPGALRMLVPPGSAGRGLAPQ